MALYKQTLQGYKDIKCSEEEILVGKERITTIGDTGNQPRSLTTRR